MEFKIKLMVIMLLFALTPMAEAKIYIINTPYSVGSSGNGSGVTYTNGTGLLLNLNTFSIDSSVCTASNGLCGGNPFNQELNTTYQVSFVNVSTNNLKASTSAGIKIISNSGTDAMLIGAGGGAGVTFYNGVTMANYLRVGSSAHGDSMFESKASTNDGSTGIIHGYDNLTNELFTLQSNGYLGLNVIVPRARLDVNGTILADSFNGSWNGSDNYYLKNNPLGYYNVTTLPTYPLGDNTTWNETRANSLYYPKNSNPQGYYNITTLPASGGDNTTWNETRANSLYTSFNYVNSIGNWSLDKSSYVLSSNLQGAIGQNLTYALINTNIGNWSADKSSYATITNVNNAVGQNLTYALINSNIGNASKHVANCGVNTVIQNITATGIQCVSDQTGTGGSNNSFNQTLTDNLYYPINSNPQGFYNISTLPASGSSNSFINYTTVNISTNGTTLKNITQLSFLALANKNYTMNCRLFYSSQNNTNGISIALEDYESTVSSVAYGVDIYGVSATTTNNGNAIAMGTKITSSAVTTINVINNANLQARIVNGESNTLIVPQYSGEVAIPSALNNTVIVKNSYCDITQG